MTATIGARIRVLRDDRKLSQDEIAKAFGFKDRQTLSAIETGERRVAADELLRAAEIFGVGLDYFTDPFLLVGEGQFSWRQTGVGRNALLGYETEAGRLIAAFRTLGRQVGRKPPLLKRSLGLTRYSSFEDASEAGERLVDELKLGDVPARRLAEAMERDLDLLVLMVDPIDGVSGAACRLPELDVVLINRREVAGRRNFDLAHELFHILTWKEMPPEHIEEAMPVKRSRVEQLADSFASAVLMPAAALDRFGDWADLNDEALIDKINATADALTVTASALRWRLVALGRLSSARAKAIADERLRNNGRARPPAQDLPLLFSRPFVEIVAAALREGKASARRLSAILGISIDEIGELFVQHGVDAPDEL